VVQLIRIYAYKSGIFQLFDVPRKEGQNTKVKLIGEGWTISHITRV